MNRKQVLKSVTVVVMLAGSLLCQTFTANITGAVTDPGGALVAGAQTVLRNMSTGETRKAVTNELGRYTFSQVLPSSYTITVTKEGFREFVQTGVQLGSNQSAEVNIQLQLGAISERVEVSAAAILLDTQTSNESSTLSTAMVESLPMSNRSALALVTATIAGGNVTSSIFGSGANDDQNIARFNIFGGRQNTSAILIDGVPATAGDWGGLIAQPGADTVQDLQVMRNTYEAQYGRTGAGVVNMTTKGGTDEYHGSAFEYFRNDHLNANDFWSNLNSRAKAKSTRNQFGANISGPIWRSKRLYGLFSFERSRYGQPGTRTTTLATPLERQGNFSQTFNANGTLQQVFDPTSTRPDPARPGYFIRSQYSGNQVPQSQWDRIATKYLELIPLPNRPGNSVTHADNYFNSGVAHFSNYRTDYRVDWAHNEKHTMWARVTKGKSEDEYGVPFWREDIETATIQIHPRYHISFGNTFIVSPTLVVNATLGGGRWFEHWPSRGYGFDMTTLGFSAALASQFDVPTSPGISMTNYSSFGTPRELILARNNYNAQINVTKELAKHSIKLGWSVESQQLNRNDAYGPSFGFTQVPTTGPDPDSRTGLSGNAFASFLLGAGSSGSAIISAMPAHTDRYYAWYVQDAWKATSRLTVNYGVRWEIQKARTERYNAQAYFDTTVTNPVGQTVGLPNLQGGIRFIDSDNRTPYDTPFKDLAPRVGIAYRITDKFVARAGYGISYMKSVNIYLSNPSNDGFTVSTPWVTSLDGGRTVKDYWANVFPQGVTRPPGSKNGLLQQLGLGVSEFIRSRPTPYLQGYSLDLQYQFDPSTVAEVGYAGSQGRKLLGPNYEANQLPESLMSMGNALLASVPNPFYGVITSGDLSGATVQRGQLLRPYPQYTSVGMLILPMTSSSFNALNVKLTRRFAAGLTMMASYQFSKSIDNASEEGSSRIRNAYNYSLERSISGHDFPHSVVLNYRYEIPVGKGKALGGSLPPVLEAILGEWSVSGIYTYTAGVPLTFSATDNTYAFGTKNQYPNISDRQLLKVDNPDRFAWFNKSALGTPANFTFGNAARYVSEVRTDSTNSMDLSIAKTFPIWENVKLQFRAEAYNAFNRNQFGTPTTNIASTTVGQVSSSRSTPRNIQLALRLTF
jgi:hypothetical protein